MSLLETLRDLVADVEAPAPSNQRDARGVSKWRRSRGAQRHRDRSRILHDQTARTGAKIVDKPPSNLSGKLSVPPRLVQQAGDRASRRKRDAIRTVFDHARQSIGAGSPGKALASA